MNIFYTKVIFALCMLSLVSVATAHCLQVTINYQTVASNTMPLMINKIQGRVYYDHTKKHEFISTALYADPVKIWMCYDHTSDKNHALVELVPDQINNPELRCLIEVGEQDNGGIILEGTQKLQGYHAWIEVKPSGVDMLKCTRTKGTATVNVDYQPKSDNI